MIKKFKILLLFLLIPFLCFSQIDLKQIKNGSIVRIDKKPYYVFDSVTVYEIVKDVIRYDECLETKDSLNSIIRDYSILSDTKSRKLEETESSNSLLKDKLYLKDEIIQEKDGQLLKAEKRAKMKNAIIYTIGGITVVETAIITTLILINR